MRGTARKWAPFLGGLRLKQLGDAIIPKFEILIKNGTKTKTVLAGFDTGMQGSDIEMPTSMAMELGITQISLAKATDASMSFDLKQGIADEVSVPASSGCTLKKAMVGFFDGAAEVLIGNNFLASLGAEISYESGKPALVCTGMAGGGLLSPAFSMNLIQGQKVLTVPAYFDTGFSSDIAIPQSTAAQLGIPVTGAIDAKTHTGVIHLGTGKMDRLGLRDLPNCFSTGVSVVVIPPDGPLQNILVGESFIEKVGGRVGYDAQGAYFACKSSPTKARAVAFARIASGNLFLTEEMGQAIAWGLGAFCVVLGAFWLASSGD